MSRCSELWVASRTIAESLCSTVDLRVAESVLDVAGNGSVALVASRRGADTTSVNDAVRLPFPDEAFDVVLSAFGAACAAPRADVAAELRRVCREGGRIGITCWAQDGFMVQALRMLARHVPAAVNVRATIEWSTSDARLAFGVADEVIIRRRQFVLRDRSPEALVQALRWCERDSIDVFAALGPAEATALEHELVALAHVCNTAGDAGCAVPSDYMEIVVTRRADDPPD